MNDFMRHIPEDAIRIMAILEEAGYEAYLVGGCVRDLLLGRIPHDYDITTSATPEETEAVFSGFPLADVGRQHGTVGVIANHICYEVTTYRIDGEYSDNRHPDSVAFTRSLAADLSRRDFSINALAMDLRGNLAGSSPEEEGTELAAFIREGFGDLKAKRIRAVRNAGERFDEDALRILRGIRFSAQLGFGIEPDTARAIHGKKALLHNIAQERIHAELSKLLLSAGRIPSEAAEPAEPAAVAVLREYRDVIAEVIPELAEGFDFCQQNPFHCYDVYEHSLQALSTVIREEEEKGREPDETLRLAALFHDVGKPSCFVVRDGWGHFYGHERKSAEMTEDVLRRLRYDNRTLNDVVELIEGHGAVLQPTEKYARRKLSQYGEEQLARLIRLERADVSAQTPEVREERIGNINEFERVVGNVLESRQCFDRKDMKLGGDDVMALGIPEGPEVGRILNAVFEKVLAGDLPNEANVLIGAAKRLLDQADAALPEGEEPESATGPRTDKILTKE
ncbi:MAG: HD domain-containing protein [Mogibacterium sp.]|nr:HD domain-containing protein [Mogibacterium sp.]